MKDANSNTLPDAANPPSAEQPEATHPEESQPEATQPLGGPSVGDQPDGGPTAAFTADQARLVLRRVKDPELNLNIVDLGLIYDVIVVGNDVRVDMSLTSPGCPSGPEIMGEAEKELRTLPGIGEAVVNLVWSPAWTPERIEPRVRAYMGF